MSDTTTPYIDDVLVGTQAVEGEDLYENHDRDVRRTLDCLVDNVLVADLRKCVFLSQRWIYVVTSWERESVSPQAES